MKKEMYDEIITVASENELAGILRVAVFDPDIMPSEFLKLAARVINIKENARRQENDKRAVLQILRQRAIKCKTL